MSWNNLAIYGANKVFPARNATELKTALEEVFTPVAPTVEILLPNETHSQTTIATNASQNALVAWQHKGVGFGVFNVYGDYSPYRSLRLNRESVKLPTSKFGGVLQIIGSTEDSIPVSPLIKALRGKEIKLTAAIRTASLQPNAQAQMWLRVDTSSKGRDFFDNMDDRPITLAEWAEYTITGYVAKSAKAIAFGCFLRGNGTMWVDKVRLCSRATSDSSWKEVALINEDFESAARTSMGDYAFPGWHFRSDAYTITPSDEQPYNGNYALMMESKASRGLNARGELIYQKPQMGERLIKPLDGGLRCALPITLFTNGKETLSSTPQSTKAFAALSDSLRQTAERDTNFYKQESMRLVELIIAWNVLQHFYPYFDVVRTNWDSTLTATLSATLNLMPQSTPNEVIADKYIDIMRSMLAALHDGHAEYYAKPNGFTPNAKVGNVEGKLVILASKDSLLQRGDVIQSINGNNASTLLANEMTLVSGTPQWKRAHAVQNLMLFPTPQVAMTIDRNGQSVQVQLLCKRTSAVNVFEHQAFQRLDTLSVLSTPANAIWYLDMEQISVKDFEEKIHELAQAKKVIVDMRGYPNDNHQILAHFSNQTLQSPRWNVPQILYPDRERPQGYDTSGRWSLRPKTPRLTGKIVFLTGGGAISQAEEVMSVVEHYKLGAIVGKTTAGANGNVNLVQLPLGLMRWTGMKVLKHDGSQHHLVGIRPTLEVKRTIAGIREGRDEVLEAALRLE